MDPLAVGERFANRYRVERLLGQGGMGAVYAAFDENLGERIALKVLFADRAVHAQALARFQREVRLARRVTSPHVARTHDIGCSEGVHYLTMELIDGVSLKDRIKRDGAMTVTETLRIGSALARGLSTAHAAGVLHRDLKPANVMLGTDGRVVITDFGIARPKGDGGIDDIQTIGFIGTPRYMAPEVIEGSAFDERSDLYALGIIVMEMLTGTPYRLSEMGDDDPTRVDTLQLDADVPPALEMLVRSMLRLAPGGRPSSAREVVDALAGVAQPAATGATATPAVVPPLPSGNRMLVLPFKARGDHEAEEFAEVLTEELVDVLARNSGFIVLPHRADEDDTVEAGARANAEWVVGGTVSRRGSRVRVSVRVTSVEDGAQLFSEKLEAEVADVFDLEDRIARRVGEALREEVTLVARRGSADAAAVDLYLRGRRKDRSQSLKRGAGLEDFAAAIERAPDFGVAIAAHAISAVRRWWVQGHGDQGEQNKRAVAASVERALRQAPDLAETHLAAGLYASQRGDYPTAVEALGRALDIAPTCALALDYLGQLECEAGRGEPGSRRIELARALDPSVVAGQAWVARWLALCGNPDQAVRHLDRVDAEQGLASVNRTQMRMRIAAWQRDQTALSHCHDLLPVSVPGGQIERLRDYIDIALGKIAIDAYHPVTMALVEAASNDRYATYALQLAAEVSCLVGEPSRGAEYVTIASRRALADVDWLERCPALAPMRELPPYPVLLRHVRKSARAIWEA